MTRTRIFVGDVHGCADELEELLGKVAFDPSLHDLWFTGDLVNRGPASLRALRLVRQLAAGSVLGNHDFALLRTAAGERRGSPRDTLDDVLRAPDREELLEWLRNRPLLVEWDDVTLVHAGLRPGWTDAARVARPLEERIAGGEFPLDETDLHHFLRVRHCDAEGRFPDDDERPPRGFHPWDRFYRGKKVVVFGHWAARGLDRTERVRALDSGCVWGGSLSAWIPDEDRFVSVAARRAYQPRTG